MHPASLATIIIASPGKVIFSRNFTGVQNLRRTYQLHILNGACVRKVTFSSF